MQRHFQRSFLSVHFERRVENTIAIQYTAGVGLWRIESSCKAFGRVFHGDALFCLTGESLAIAIVEYFHTVFAPSDTRSEPGPEWANVAGPSFSGIGWGRIL